MRYLLKFALFFSLSAVEVVSQTTKSPIVRQYVEVPSENVLLTVAYQPESSIRFENLKYLFGIEGGGTKSYQLRNIGKKPIMSVTVFSSNGAGATFGSSKSDKVLMKPGQLMPEPVTNIKDEILPLTDELREKFDITKGKMRAIVVIMVVRVEFADGTVFSDEKAAKAMETYMEDFADIMSEQEVKKWKKKP